MTVGFMVKLSRALSFKVNDLVVTRGDVMALLLKMATLGI